MGGRPSPTGDTRHCVLAVAGCQADCCLPARVCAPTSAWVCCIILHTRAAVGRRVTSFTECLAPAVDLGPPAHGPSGHHKIMLLCDINTAKIPRNPRSPCRPARV